MMIARTDWNRPQQGQDITFYMQTTTKKKTETYKTDRRMEGRTDTWTDGHPKRIYDRLSRGRRVQGIHRRTCANVLY